ncbi:MAG: cytidine deaminase [Clostridia bacterium]|nr:cytidine deaminase [Clostridia bacterium]
MITANQKKELIKKSKSVRKNSYSPYSNYKVGAALLAKSGKIYIGTNFENAAFGAGICAERVALGSAISAGEREFLAICVCGNSMVLPCGICRQTLSEFDDIEIICCDENGNEKQYMLSSILPHAFQKKQLNA